MHLQGLFMFNMLYKNFSRQYVEIFLYTCFPENRIRHIRQIVLPEYVRSYFLEEINSINLSFAEFAHSVLSIKSIRVPSYK